MCYWDVLVNADVDTFIWQEKYLVGFIFIRDIDDRFNHSQ